MARVFFCCLLGGTLLGLGIAGALSYAALMYAPDLEILEF
jgi:hypothetical protein